MEGILQSGPTGIISSLCSRDPWDQAVTSNHVPHIALFRLQADLISFSKVTFSTDRPTQLLASDQIGLVHSDVVGPSASAAVW